ncbi:MAG: protein translocase subunit SecF [Deltaproteobacteria bacterium]|nr:protein translocase subunit SecF [bacterium]MCB9476748.1 protein translocase subunit SecF [Deltaproteobacteria bacterium]MCB9487437.1 protein translocase subunit SecF [Deltaproteobacteria bacterium]
MQFLKSETQFDFVRWMKPATIFSSLMIVAALILIFTKGFNYGIDFAGGVEMRVGLPNGVTTGEVRDAVGSLKLPSVDVAAFLIPDKNVFSIKAKGEENVVQAVGEAAQEEKLPDVAVLINEKLGETFGKDKVEVISTDLVGPRVGKNLRRKGLLAILYSMAAILLYISFRFNMRYSPGAVIALMHDVIAVAGIFSLINHEISLSVIAALLTVAGYSVNDTIIIMDRIREGHTVYRGQSIEKIVNNSINDTLSRTLLTSFTTFIVVLAIYVFGSEIIQDFALSLLIGIFFGTYSTIFISTPIYIGLENFSLARRKAARAARK